MSKTAKLVTYLVRAFVLIVLSLVGNHVTGYIFSVPINSSSIISIDYNIRRSSKAPKRPKSIPQGRLVFISCLINANKTVKQDGPSTFQGSKWFCMYFMRKFNSSWYRIPRGKYMAGLSGLFRSPWRKSEHKPKHILG